MTNIKYTLNDLFFKQTKNKPRYIRKNELENPLDLNDFYIIMIDAVSLCNDETNLDRERLMALYSKYTDAFYNNKNFFAENLCIKNKRNAVSRTKIFGDMIPITKTATNIDFYRNRCYKNAEELLRARQSQVSLESYIRKYGEEVGKTKYYEYCENRKADYAKKPEVYKQRVRSRLKKMSKISKEYYIDKINPVTGKTYTEKEMIEEISKVQTIYSKKSAEKRTLQNKKTHDVTCRQINYWINKGYSYEESLEKVRNIQTTNTLEHYVKKYGYDMGLEEWKKRNGEWGNKMLELKSKSGKTGNAYSKAACKLFDTVLERLEKESIIFKKVYYGEKEFSKWDTKNKRVYFYDLVIEDIKLCVEYNGIMFHPKPGDLNWKSLYGKTYDEAIQYDMQKQQCIKDLGYELIVVWEDEVFEKSVNIIMKKCKELYN